MSRDEFDRLYAYLSEQFARIDARFEEIDERFTNHINTIYGLLDHYAKRREDYEEELAATGLQLTRHDGWIRKIADKTNTRLI